MEVCAKYRLDKRNSPRNRKRPPCEFIFVKAAVFCRGTLAAFVKVLRTSLSKTLKSDIQQIAVRLQRAVRVVDQHLLGQHFAQLHSFLVEAVDIPHKALKHHLILKVG